MNIQEFSPAKAEIQAAVLEVEGLTINGVDDEAGYEAVKVGKKKLADYRIKISKFGKEQREEALAWQREVLRQEKELLAMIEPTETKLKGALEAIDEEKKRKEREVLLPGRKAMLAEIEEIMTDEEILAMDEKEFSEFYTGKKMTYLEAKEAARKKEEEDKKRAEELEKAKAEAAEKARQEERERANREIEEAQRKLKESELRKEREAKEKEEAEKAEQERTEKNRKYKKWLKDNGMTEENKGEFIVKQLGLNDKGETGFELYKKISSINIK